MTNFFPSSYNGPATFMSSNVSAEHVFLKAFNSYLVYRAALLFEEIVFLLWNHNLVKRNYEVIAKSFLKQKYFQRYRNVFICRMFDIVQLMVT